MTSAEEQLRQYYMCREMPTDSIEYQDSLDIYLTLRSMFKSGKIDPIDIQVVDAVISGYSFRKTAQILNIDRRSAQSRYRKVLALLEESL